MMTIHKILGFLHWQKHAKTKQGHRVHSPFLFSLIQNHLHKKISTEWAERAEQQRKKMLCNNSIIEINDLGTGSKFAHSNRRSIKSIARWSSTSKRDAQLLYNLANYMQSQTIVELGTNLGLGTIYLAHVPSCKRVITIEGCSNLVRQAQLLFKSQKLDNIEVINNDFSIALPMILERVEQLDFVFFDGNHSYKPTIEYFNYCLPLAHNNTVFVFDDIHKDKEMEKAWREIVNNEKITLSLDFYTLGVAFFKRELSKQTICLRY